MIKQSKIVLFALTTLLAFAPWMMAGPPLICHALDIGNAQSLPWNPDLTLWNQNAKTNYDRSHLVQDTLALLTPATPVIVRMETLRRATLYAAQDQEIAKRLLIAVRARALELEKSGHPDALASFDLGYLIECYKQANLSYRKLDSGGWEAVIRPNPASHLDGYAWVEKAIRLRGEDSEIEFAAALMAIEGPAEQRSHRLEHGRRAVAGAGSDTLLASNLHQTWDSRTGETLASMLTRVETATK
ncbi:MAG TPA: hypothetical protein VJV74_02850 [Terriglobia bacterium]|nr:hypothetical protein [Terriglobia bacterium]